MGLSAQTLAELRSTLDMLDSADLIKFALLAEIDRLSRELGECQVGHETGSRAVAENLRLREALEWIAAFNPVDAEYEDEYQLRDRARQALEGKR